MKSEWHRSCVGKYQIRKILGKGGQATALLAWDPDLQRQVVVKVYHSAQPRPSGTPFCRSSMARVRSPFVAQCFGAERHERTPYLVVEYVDGPSEWIVLDERPVTLSYGFLHVFHDSRTTVAERR